MKRVITANESPKLTFFPATTADEIAQNIYCILNTVKGEVPMYREFGLDHSFMHQPSQVAQSAYAAAIAEAVTQFEPRAQVTNVTFDDNAKPGQMCPLVEVVFLADGE